MRSHSSIAAALIAMAIAVAGLPSRAEAFCGFYVAGADSNMYANATMVVLMRDGTRTVLSMQNNYQGPPDAFALVIPVPTVLTQDQVKILPKSVFQHVDALGAPRLVEYWEDDPCRPQFPELASAGSAVPPTAAASDAGVKVEAQFTVGEYDVVVLSANDSSALESWLHTNNYNVPNGAAAVLQQYVAMGTKFFVAKVDSSKVTFVNGQAALSPLRFYYDTPDFTLPVRLGLLNSQGTQDLIVNILAPTRFEVANYPNVTVPTNLLVQNDVRDAFPGFYEALFSKLTDMNPGSVVTEYSWDSASCDPCPTPPLEQSDLATLGADVTRGLGTDMTSGPNGVAPSYVDYTLTRLHYRYTKDNLGQDLVFKQADSIMGGRGIPDASGKLDPTVQSISGGSSNFQGRYVILHPWTDAVTCANPMRGSWGYGSNGAAPPATGLTNAALSGMPPAPANLSSLLAQSVPALGVDVGATTAGGAGSGGKAPAADGGSAGSLANAGAAGLSPSAGTGASAAGVPTTIQHPSAKTNNGCSACSVGAPRSLPPSAAGAALFTLGAFALRRRVRSNKS